MPTDTPRAGGGNILTRKVGPLPGWGWALVGVGGIFLLRKYAGGLGGASSTSTTAAAPVDTAGASGSSGPSYGAPYSGPSSLGLGANDGYGATSPGGDPNAGGLQPADGSGTPTPATAAKPASSVAKVAARTPAALDAHQLHLAAVARHPARYGVTPAKAKAAAKPAPVRRSLPKPATHKPKPLDRHQRHLAAVARHPSRYAKRR